MVNSKTYLNVSYAEKDAVKALGGRWDPAKKKWYVPANTDLTPFVPWIAELGTTQTSSITKMSLQASTRPAKAGHAKKPVSGAVTRAADKNFVAYSGNEPPWD